MSMPRNANQIPNSFEDQLLDRLVAGDLPDPERREFLLHLESEPGGWRRCALTFLEAQTWREAFAPMVAPVHREVAVVIPNPPPVKPSSRRGRVREIMMIASLLLAFLLGWKLHHEPSEVVVVKPSEPSTQAILAPSPDPEEVIPVAPKKAPAEPVRPPTALASIVKALEQRGYESEWQTGQVTVKRQDGQKVTLPVQEVRLRSTAGRTY